MSLAFTSPQRRSLRAISVSMVLLALVFIASCKKDDDTTDTPPGNNPPTPGTLVGGIDQEGDAFTSVIIGSQEWMSENLSVASYTDGTPIPHITNPAELYLLTSGAWCWYNNDSATYAAIYGRLYNWYAVAGIYNAESETNPSLRKQLAPIGWHVPSDAEWSTMINFLDSTAAGGSNTPNTVGGMMKTMGTIEAGTGLWFAPNEMASNESGFSAIPGGYRSNLGDYMFSGYYAKWWCSSEIDSSLAWNRIVSSYYDSAIRDFNGKRYCLSVRCVRD